MADFDYLGQSAKIARQRKLADMLQAQAFKPSEMPTTPGAKMSWLEPLAKMLGGGLSAWQEDKAATADKDLQAELNKQRSALLAQGNGTPEIPGVPIAQEATVPPDAPPGPPPTDTPAAAAFGPTGMPMNGPRDNELKGSGSALAAQLLSGGGTGATDSPLATVPPPDGAAPPGPTPPPMLPRAAPLDMAIPGAAPKLTTDMIPAKLPTAEDYRTKGEKLLALGDPISAVMGKDYLSKGIDADAPMSRKDLASLQQEKELKIEALKQRELEMTIRSQDMRLSIQQRADAAKEAAAARRDAAQFAADARRDAAQYAADARRDVASANASKNAHSTTEGVTSDTGMPVERDAVGNRYTVDQATGKHTPYAGEVIPKATHEKNVAATSKLENEAQQSEAALAFLKGHPKAKQAFETVRRAGMGVGLSPQQAGIGDEGQEFLAMIGHNYAEQLKALYGASFTTSEQERAGKFTITNKDDYNSAMIKLRDGARFVRQMAKKHGGAAAAAAARRMGTTAESPAYVGDKQYDEPDEEALMNRNQK